MQAILFCLEQCTKCDATKEYFKNKTDISIKIITFPHDFKQWTDKQKSMADEYNILEDLQTTAPVLIVPDRLKLIGQLKIKQWIDNGYEEKKFSDRCSEVRMKIKEAQKKKDSMEGK